MINEKFKSFLIEVYQELNIHHRTQTTQNNQIITFYIALISFFFGFHSKLVKDFDMVLVNFVFITLIFIGFIINLMLIQLRVWQLRYAISIQFIGSVFMCDKVINNFSEFYSCMKTFESKSKTLHSIFAPLTCKMIWGCIFISLAPIGLYYEYLKNIILNSQKILFIAFIIVIAMYVLLIGVCFSRKTKKVGRKGDVLWMLNCFNFKDSITIKKC